MADVGEQGRIVFSSGEEFSFTAQGFDGIFNYSATVGRGTTNGFVRKIRAAQWVDISFGGESHRFSLTGSGRALDQIQPYLL